MPTSKRALQTAPVHTSLQRRPTMGGLPQDAFLLLALIMVSMCIAARLDPKVLAGCGVVYLVLLPLFRRLFEKDPFFMSILPRALRYAPRYPRQAKEVTRHWRDRIIKTPLMDPLTFGLGTVTGAGALWGIRRLQRLHAPAEGLGDLLGWAFLVDDGIILMKDGSLLRGLTLYPPDLDTSTSSEANSVTETVHDALMLLGHGYAMEVNVHRTCTSKYPLAGKSSFPTESLHIMERERKDEFNQRGFSLRHTVLFTYTPPREFWAKWEGPMIQGSRMGSDYTQVLNRFKVSLQEVSTLLQSQFGVHPMNSTELITECHTALTGHPEPVFSPPHSFLSHALASEDFQTGFYPVMGGQHLFMVTISSLGSQTMVGEGSFFNEFQGHGRWHLRFIHLDRLAAERRIKRLQNSWFHQRRGLRKLIAPDEEGFEDQDAVAMQRESGSAHAESASGRAKFGYFTNTFILRDPHLQRGLERSQILLQALRDRGYSASLETVNATDAFMGSLPGHGYANLRRPLLSSRNIVHVFPVSAPWQGQPICPNPLFSDRSPALGCARTSGGMSFMVNLYQADVGHTLVIGATGAGKSVLVGWLALNFLRYPKSRVHIFDLGRSHEIPCLASNGVHYTFGDGPALQPLRHIDEESERLWALTWLETLYDLGQELPDADGRLALANTLELLSESAPEHRTLSAFHLLLSQPLQSTALRYTTEGPYGQIFDGDSELSDQARMQVYELGEVLEQGDAVMVPLLLALFRKIERTLDGSPTLIVIEEAWAALLRSRFADRIRAWLLTLRKRNAAVLLVAHSPAQITSLPNAALITESCPTKILLPNPEAKTSEAAAMYRDLGLSTRAIQVIASAKPKRDYFYYSLSGSRLFDLDLGPAARTLLMPLSQMSTEASRIQIRDAMQRYGHDFLHQMNDL